MQIETITEDAIELLSETKQAILAQPGQSSIQRSRQVCTATMDTLDHINRHLREYSFPTAAKEITFFKEIIPEVYTTYLYYQAINHAEISKPTTAKEGMRQYYTALISETESILQKDIELIRYYRSGGTFLDQTYFTRSGNLAIHNQLSCALDRKVTTIQSFQLARISANESLITYLAQAREDDAARIDEQKQDTLPELVWTDTKTGLTELIYALQSMGCFNNGKADIKRITTVFEKVFKVELGNTSRTFQVIMSRQKDYADYLNKLLAKFLERIDKNEQKHIR